MDWAARGRGRWGISSDTRRQFKLLRLQKLFLPKGPAAFIFIQMASITYRSPTEKITDVCLYFSPLVSTTVDILFSLSLALSPLSLFYFFLWSGLKREGGFRWAKGLRDLKLLLQACISLSLTHTPHSLRPHHDWSLCVAILTLVLSTLTVSLLVL